MRLEQNSANRSLVASLLLLPLVAFAACGGEPAGMPEAEADPEPAAAPSGPPRVFFVAPQDGDILSADHDVELEFGVENLMISPPPDAASGEAPREGVGHYHLGVGTGCVPAGEAIPEGDDRVDFDDGSNRYTLQRQPGTYELSVQVANDANEAQDGLCETITIEIADGV
ncbi:MAG: DUF4399 domain-containing protein [Acidobacteria bacterium]|nr:DUF4399 domain-containing protein [Acidobacteriota bacterium]